MHIGAGLHFAIAMDGAGTRETAVKPSLSRLEVIGRNGNVDGNAAASRSVER